MGISFQEDWTDKPAPPLESIGCFEVDSTVTRQLLALLLARGETPPPRGYNNARVGHVFNVTVILGHAENVTYRDI